MTEANNLNNKTKVSIGVLLIIIVSGLVWWSGSRNEDIGVPLTPEKKTEINKELESMQQVFQAELESEKVIAKDLDSEKAQVKADEAAINSFNGIFNE